MLAAGLKASLEDVDDGGHDADDVYDDDEVLPPLLDDEVLLETENADDVFSYSGGNSFTDGVNVGTWWRNVTQVGGLIDEDNDVRVQLPCGYGKSQLAV